MYRVNSIQIKIHYKLVELNIYFSTNTLAG